MLLIIIMVKTKSQEAAAVRTPRKRRRDAGEDNDIIEDTDIETSRDSDEVDDEMC